MRVTTQMVASNMMSNLDELRGRLQSNQTDLATGISIHVPSDAPEKIALAMQYKVGLRQLDTYNATMKDSMGWLQTTDGTMDQIQKDLTRLRQLAVNASTSANSSQSLDAIRTETNAVYKDLLGLANNQYNGKYIFAGAKIDQQPFVEDNAANPTVVNYKGDSLSLTREIGPGIKQAANFPGSQLPLAGAGNLFDTLIQFQKDLQTGTSTALSHISTTIIGNLETSVDQFSTQRALLGVRMEQLQTLQERNKDTQVNLEDLLSKTIGTDMEKTSLNLALSRNSYQVALAVGAKIVPPTLVDFLR